MTSPTERLLAKLPDATQTGKGWSARCPAHEDRRASLSIGVGDDGRALVKCHAGCKADAICAAVGLTVLDLMSTADMLPTPIKSKTKSTNCRPRIVATYNYRDETGALLSQVVRFDPKDFRQRRPKPGGGWEWSVKGVRVVPYRLPEILADSTRPVIIVEGEKDVDNLARIGVLATCNAGGAGKWSAEHASFLRGRRVVIIPDNDEAGRNHVQLVARTLHGIAQWIRVVELPGLPAKGDVSDWLAAGGTKEDLRQLSKTTPLWTPSSSTTPEWPEINSLDVVDLPEFPTHVLPPVLRNWVEAESHATQTPADLAALLSMSVCSAMIARRVVVEPRPGWREPVNLYTAALLEPGNRKSAVFTDAIAPLREIEAELIEAARPDVARALSRRRMREREGATLEKRSADKGDADAAIRAQAIAAELAESPAPVLPRLIADDATTEKLGMLLADQGGRIASMSPEGSVFDVLAGLYSKSGMPSFGAFLLAHAGDALITDRVSRPSLRVERPALTCAYAMQPQVIKGLAENAAFRGRGLLARFLYAAPLSWIGHRDIAPAPVPDAIREAYRLAVRALADVQDGIVLVLSVDASILLQVWEAEIEAMLADGGDMEVMRDWGAKLAGATLRLAAVLHCVARGAIGCIEASNIAEAVTIARYLIPHAEAVLDLMQAKDDSSDDDARYLLRWILRHEKRHFKKTEAQQHGKRRFPTADAIDAALAELVRRHYIRERVASITGPGRPPSPTYDVHPTLFATANPKKRSINSVNSPESTAGGNLQNIQNSFGGFENANRVRVAI